MICNDAIELNEYFKENERIYLKRCKNLKRIALFSSI